MEYKKIIDVKSLRESANIEQIPFGQIFGYKRQQVGIWEKNPEKIPFTVTKLMNLLFWKELGVSREEIMQELGLNEFSAEPGAAYDPQTPREQYLHKELQEAKKREEIYQMTIRALQDRKPNKDEI